jgi:dinuclear metal center YbgI/SA1388 family protein
VLTDRFLAVVERLAPAALAEDWDNVGLLVGRHDRPVRRVLVALELREAVLAEARDRGADALLVHHPPVFPALAAVTDATPAAALVLSAAEERRTVVAAHTNLDAAPGGLNDHMAALLGMTGAVPLVPAATGQAGAGLGRVGTVAPVALGAYAARVAALIPGAVVHTGDPGATVGRVACCTGSGASMIDDARAAGADLYVTGDLKHHDADRAAGMPLLSVSHAQTERIAMRGWFATLRDALAPEGVEALFAEADTDPWRPVR